MSPEEEAEWWGGQQEEMMACFSSTVVRGNQQVSLQRTGRLGEATDLGRWELTEEKSL